MMRSISSMSATIPVRSASSRVPISTPRRSRASGVRRSCDTPASSTARSCSICRRLAVIVLKPRLTAAISEGPDSGSGGGVSPRPTRVDRGRQFAQRTREVAREHECGDQQEREHHQRPRECARRDIVGGRARRYRDADPVGRSRGDDAHEQHLQPRRETDLGLGAQPLVAGARPGPASADRRAAVRASGAPTRE